MGERINHKTLARKYGEIHCLIGYYYLKVKGASICIGPDVFRYQIGYQFDDEPNTVCEEYVDYAELSDEGINPYDLKAVATFIVERGESWDTHENVGELKEYMDGEIIEIKEAS